MTTSKIDQLTKKREELNAQIQALKAKENQKKRKDETRKKTLIGGVVMKMLKNGEMPQERLNQLYLISILKKRRIKSFLT